jgi:hypothetical protein
MNMNYIHWQAPPAKGMKNPLSNLYKFTIVRLSDSNERFTNRKPRKDLNRIDFMVWDNEENQEVKN